MILHKLGHLLFIIAECLLVSCFILHFNINNMRLLLSWFHCWICTPILMSLIIRSRTYKAGMIQLKHVIFIFLIGFWLNLKWLVFCLMGRSEISLNFIRYSKFNSFLIKIKFLRFSIWIELAIFLFIIGFNVLGIFVE